MPADKTRHGIRANRWQFLLLVLAGGFSAAIVGVERSVLPLLAEQAFGLATATAALGFISAFGLSKAVANFFAGDLAGRIGRRRVLVAGWLLNLPVPALVIFAPSWGWIVFANLLLGTGEGFIWSSSVIMRIDLAGGARRGLAVGLGAFAGPVALGATAFGAGYIAAAHGARTAPFLISVAMAVLGIATALMVRDTADHVRREADGAGGAGDVGAATGAARPERTGAAAETTGPAATGVPDGILARLRYISWTNRRLLATNQAGLALHFSDALVWGIFPLFLTAEGLDTAQVGLVAGLYPLAIGAVEIGTGHLSDRWGRRPLILAGMLLQATALVGFAALDGLRAWVLLAVALGAGYAAVLPTLTAQASDLVSPRDRPAAVGGYRFWRDGGHAVGGLAAGALADALGFRPTMVIVAGVLAVSGATAYRVLRR